MRTTVRRCLAVAAAALLAVTTGAGAGAAAPAAEGASTAAQAKGSVRVITHNLAKQPGALDAVKARAAVKGDEVILLQEVCQDMVPAVKQLGATSFRKRIRNQNCGSSADGKHKWIGEAAVFTGSASTSTVKLGTYTDADKDKHRFGMACVTFKDAGVPVRACSTHLITGKDRASVRKRTELTTKIRRHVSSWERAAGNRVVVVAGDFNSTPGKGAMNPMYAKGAGAKGVLHEVHQLASGSAARRGHATMGASCAKDKGAKIDYIFVSARHTRLAKGQATEKAAKTASDHCMLWGTVKVS